MRKIIFFIFVIALLANGCKDKSLIITTPPLSDYFPLQTGKYITYRLDSTVTTTFGAGLTTHSYRAKDIVDAQITDGLGRPAYRIFRNFTDTAAAQSYKPLATYQATAVGTDWMEYLDNNLRFMKLRFPIQEGFTWKGNSFINTTSSTNAANNFLDSWDYTYKNVDQPYTVLGKTFQHTVTVIQRDENIPDGPFNPANYKQRNYSIEVYAQGIGLIYKEFLHYIYQPATPNRGAYYEDESYGVKLQVLDYN